MFVIKKGDTSPAIQGTLSTQADLTGASVRFIMQDASGDIVLDEVANVTSVANKTVVYQWAPGETDITGRYRAEFKITYADLRVETFPNIGYIPVYIEPKLEDEVV